MEALFVLVSWALSSDAFLLSTTCRKNPVLTRTGDGPRLYQQHQDHFQRAASNNTVVQEDCILLIHGSRYNLTEWAKGHPGGLTPLL